MKYVLFVLAAAAIIFGAYCWHENIVNNLGGEPLGDNESYSHKANRFRAGADNAVLAACTNYTVGLKSIISLQCDTDDNNFLNWTATATVEYINTVGGIERTNYEFRPQIFNGTDLHWFQQ
jgi:hypothetical protein